MVITAAVSTVLLPPGDMRSLIVNRGGTAVEIINDKALALPPLVFALSPGDYSAQCLSLKSSGANYAYLGNTGRTVSYYETKDAALPSASSFASLVSAMKAGTVQTLVVLGGNPVFDAPADLDFAAAMVEAGRLGVRLNDMLSIGSLQNAADQIDNSFIEVKISIAA